MKKLVAFLLGIGMLISCSTSRYVSLADPQAEFDAVEILYNQHPELVNYYEQGVLKITSLREVKVANGYDYRIKYKFVKYHYYDYAERMACLKEKYPELYTMYVNGTIEINSLYKYVDEYGAIRYHVSYRRLYDFYYDTAPLIYPYNGYRYYYRPRPIPPRVGPPPRPRPNNPPPKAEPNRPPRQQPNMRPNNPPRQQPPTGGGQGSRPPQGRGRR